jgi:hypothetical protein
LIFIIISFFFFPVCVPSTLFFSHIEQISRGS